MNKFKFLLFTVALAGSIAVASAEEGKQLLESKCDKCHELERSLSKSKDLAAWKSTTLRMSRYSGGAITDKEAVAVAQYLAGREKSGTIVIPEKESVNKENPTENKEHFDFKKVGIAQFIKPEICADCHSEIFKQWNGSMHSKAFVDPIWQKATKLFNKEAVTNDQILEMQACVKSRSTV